MRLYVDVKSRINDFAVDTLSYLHLREFKIKS